MSWAQLLKRVFAIDLAACPQCGSPVTLIAAIEEPAVIVKILAHLGLPTRAPNGIRLRNGPHSFKDRGYIRLRDTHTETIDPEGFFFLARHVNSGFRDYRGEARPHRSFGNTLLDELLQEIHWIYHSRLLSVGRFYW